MVMDQEERRQVGPNTHTGLISCDQKTETLNDLKVQGDAGPSHPLVGPDVCYQLIIKPVQEHFGCSPSCPFCF